MHRRDFLKTSGTLLAAAVAAAAPAPAALAQNSTRTAPGRTVLPINRNWRFHPSLVAGSESPSFDDSSFTPVILPHTNVPLPWHNFDDRQYEFVSTYRRRFRLPAAVAEGKRVFVDFEGAMTASTVFINGHRLGEYKGGFTPFSFELTPHLRPSSENVLVVHLDSTERADIPPFGNEIDYLTFGGIYREVQLRIVPHTSLENIHARTLDVLTNPRLEVDVFLDTPTVPATTSHKPGKLELRAELFAAAPTTTFSSAPRPSVEPIPTTTPLATATSKLPTPAPTPQLNPADAGQAQGALPLTHPNALPTKPTHTLSLSGLKDIHLWDLDHPNLYTVRVTLLEDGHPIDELTRRIGFREANFTDGGFELNGKVVKLRGLDRHQTFPFVGQAMPARPQRQDAKILRHGLHCNIVRTSHYPQSRHFLDACDETGLLVLEEIPGWQHIGPLPWQDIAVDNVRRMITRDWNHPSVLLWGVRINESRDNHNFYTRTNALAHALDITRQTGGIRYFQESEFLEDVFTMNDFGFPLKKPNHPRYLNTEFVGHTYPTKTTDDDERQREHTLRHARIHNQLASDPQYAGGIGWCAFDYNTHANFGAGDRICYHGVTDIFRENKPAAGFYKSQCDLSEEIVLEPAFHWAHSDESVGFTKAVVCSNCDHLKIFVRPLNTANSAAPQAEWQIFTELDPNRADFPHLTYPPFVLDLDQPNSSGQRLPWGDLRIDGFLQGKQVISKSFSGDGVDRKFTLLPDDTHLLADGSDTTRVVLRVTDQFDALRTYSNDPIHFTLTGPADLIGDNPFALIGGTGAIWIRAQEQSQAQPGAVTLTATHPRLGSQTITFTLTPVPPEPL